MLVFWRSASPYQKLFVIIYDSHVLEINNDHNDDEDDGGDDDDDDDDDDKNHDTTS